MTQGQINKRFLESVDKKTSRSILDAIEVRYGVDRDEAIAELTSDEAWHLLDYLVEPQRSATSVLMQRHAFAMPSECGD